MKTTADLHEFYRIELKPDLLELEKTRKEIFKRIAIVAAVGLGLEILLLIAGVREPFLFIVAGVLAVGIGYLAAGGLYKEYKRTFKSQIIQRIVTFVDPGLRYSPSGRISQSTYRRSGIFRHDVDRYNGDDLVEGTIGKTEVEFSELHSEYKTTTTDSKGRTQTHWHTIFKGLFFSADFNKDFSGTTYVLPDTAEKLFGFLGSKLQALGKSHGELVKMEDPTFEREFVVYGSDQIGARYILSPALMKRITDFKAKSGRKLHLSFVGTRVYAAVSYKRKLFEPSLFRSLLDFTQIQEYFTDLELAIGIVEDLNLNTRIWTKE